MSQETKTLSQAMGFFERHLTLWVVLCIVAGVALGQLLPGPIQAIGRLEVARVNIPVGLLIWVMIIPMLLKIDFAALHQVKAHWKGIGVTLFVNWAVKPFSMAFLAWLFIRQLFAPYLPAEQLDSYVAGLILLAAAPCTAMVFVWSYLTDGDPGYTLVQVSVNDLLMLLFFAPIVKFLVSGASNLIVPFGVLFTSVVVFIVIPLAAGVITRNVLIKSHGPEWFNNAFLPKLHPVAIGALLATLVLIFAFQADNITGRLFHVLLIAVPITIQVYFNSSLAYGLMKWLKLPYNVAAPGALIGASNFFELAVAVAITIFGPESGAALACVVGVLVEVPVMLSVCSICNRTRHWFPRVAC